MGTNITFIDHIFDLHEKNAQSLKKKFPLPSAKFRENEFLIRSVQCYKISILINTEIDTEQSNYNINSSVTLKESHYNLEFQNNYFSIMISHFYHSAVSLLLRGFECLHFYASSTSL